MESVAKIGPSEWDNKREAKTRLVQLVNRNDDEGTRLRLLPPPGRFGICPVDVALLGLRLYHSGVDVSKPDSSSSLLAR